VYAGEQIPRTPSGNRPKGRGIKPQWATPLIKSQSNMSIKEIPLIEQDQKAQEAIEYLRNTGYTPEQINEAMLRPVPATKQNIRQAERDRIDDKIKTTVGILLKKYNLNYEGKDLDHAHLGRNNFVIVKSEIDKAVNCYVGMKENERKNFTQEQYDKINSNYDDIINSVERKLFYGES
jgi:ribosomal protein S20